MINSNGQSISDILRSRINNDSQTVLNGPEKFLTIEDFITFYDPHVDDMPLSFLTKRLYTAEEDILLLHLKHFSQHMTYKEMSEMFENRTAESLKQRFRYLAKI